MERVPKQFYEMNVLLFITVVSDVFMMARMSNVFVGFFFYLATNGLSVSVLNCMIDTVH